MLVCEAAPASFAGFAQPTASAKPAKFGLRDELDFFVQNSPLLASRLHKVVGPRASQNCQCFAKMAKIRPPVFWPSSMAEMASTCARCQFGRREFLGIRSKVP
jgi:hypothetical protein